MTSTSLTVSAAPYIQETTLTLNEALEKGKTILLEGAQGTLLDPDFGTYPTPLLPPRLPAALPSAPASAPIK